MDVDVGMINVQPHTQQGGVRINTTGDFNARNPLEARPSSRRTDECAFQIPFYAERANTHPHTEDSCTLNWHSSYDTQHTQEYWLSLSSKTSLTRDFCRAEIYSMSVFLMTQQQASIKRSTKHNLTWRQPLRCTVPHRLHHVKEKQQSVTAAVKLVRHL